VHQAHKAGKFPAGLEHQFKISTGFGALDNTEAARVRLAWSLEADT
jgi:hypothetical protein